MRSDELERVAEQLRELAFEVIELARRVVDLHDEVERLATYQYADEQEPPLLALRKGTQ